MSFRPQLSRFDPPPYPPEAFARVIAGIAVHVDEVLEAVETAEAAGEKQQALQAIQALGKIRSAAGAIREAIAPLLGQDTQPSVLSAELIAVLREEELLESLVAIFEEMAVKTLGGMEVALEREDRKAVANAAHLLKGSAVNFGAGTFAATCQTIEQTAETASTDDLSHLLQALKTNYDEVMAALRREIAQS